MSRPGICSVCSRSDAADIDHALAMGSSVRNVSCRFGLKKSSVARHLKNHVSSRLKRAAEERKTGSDLPLLDRLRELNPINRGILAKAYNAGNLPTALAAVARAEKLIELEFRLLGQLRDTTVNEPAQSESAHYVIVFENGTPKTLPADEYRNSLPPAIETHATGISDSLGAREAESPGKDPPAENDATDPENR